MRQSGVRALPVALALCACAATAVASTTVTPAHAAAVASAINLRHGDVSGYAQKPNPLTRQEARQNAQLTKCAGGVQTSHTLILAQSPYFTTQTQSIASAVEIFTSPALARQDVRASSTPRGITCVTNFYYSQFRSGASKNQKIAISESGLPSIVSGIAGATAFRLTILSSVTKGSTTLTNRIVFDFVAFTVGQVEVDLSVSGAGPEPSASLERRLTELLLARAKTAAG
jgi:hypothetical protein